MGKSPLVLDNKQHQNTSVPCLTMPGQCTSIQIFPDGCKQSEHDKKWYNQIIAAGINIREAYDKVAADADSKLAFFHVVICGAPASSMRHVFNNRYTASKIQNMVDSVAKKILGR